MRENIFQESTGNSLFKNEDALSPDYFPEQVIGRESQISELAACLKPIEEGRKCAHAFIFGPPGTGKTTCCRKVIEELTEYTTKAKCIYANCWQHSSRQALLSLIAEKIEPTLPRRGIAGDEILQRVTEQLKRANKTLVIILDEADKLFFNNEQNVLYDLGRLKEVWGANSCVILVSNSPDLMTKLDSRIRSSLLGSQISFNAYSPIELKKIVSERAKTALRAGCYSDDVIALCAALGAKNGGDARVALKALFLAAKTAEKRGSDKITADDARKSFGESQSSAQMKAERDSQLLGEEDNLILDFLKAGVKTSGEIYEFVERKLGESDRNARKRLEKLIAKNLVQAEDGQKGSRVFSLKK
ncbi:AAA family ATPase [Candidatus Micrarchaeota archaeon]|nr:AAA family ATPase [Candidatus Micrarchaeota archaeon]